jgi:hypothetical protein
VGTVEVLGMPLLTSAMDRQIEETVSKNGKIKMQSVVHQHKRQVKNSIHNNYSEMQHPKETAAEFHIRS